MISSEALNVPPQGLAVRRVAQRAFVSLARAALADKAYDRALRAMAAGAVLSDDPSFLLDADIAEPYRFVLWRCALSAAQHSSSLILRGGTGPRNLCFRADSRHVVAGGWKAVRVWDLETGEEIAAVEVDGDVFYAALSPDGKRMAGGYQNGNAALWEVESGKKIADLKSDGPGPVYSLAFTPDGAQILTGVPTGIAVWEADTAALVRVWTDGSGWYSGAAFSPDGKWVVAGLYHSKVQVFDVTTGKKIAELDGPQVEKMAFSGDGQRVITGSSDETTRVWEVATGKQLAQFRTRVVEVALSRDGTLALTSLGETASLWDVATGEQIRSWQAPGYGVSALAFDPIRGRAMVGASGGTFVWDTHRGEEIAVFRGHTAGVLKAAFSPDGTRAVTASDDTTARIWEVATGRTVVVLRGHTKPVLDAAFTADGQRVLTGSADDARLWDAQTGKEFGVARGWNQSLDGLLFSPDGTRVVIWKAKTKARLLDAATGTEVAVLEDSESMFCAAFSADGSLLSGGCFGQRVVVWSGVNGNKIASMAAKLNGDGGCPASVAFSPDGKRLMACYIAWFTTMRNQYSGSNNAIIWDVASCKQIGSLLQKTTEGEAPHQTTCLRDIPLKRYSSPSILSVVFSPNGRLALTGADDWTIRVWDAAAGAEMGALRGHAGSVLNVAFSADGSRALTCSDDCTARVWDVSRWSAFTGDRGVYLAAALAGGLGVRDESESGDMLMQNLPEDLYAALMERLDPDQRALVPEASRRLRLPLDSNCYRRHATK